MARYRGVGGGCLVLDLRMPEVDGLAVMERLAARGISLPIVIVTGAGDIRSCSRAFKMGVFDFLEKPVDEHELLGAVQRAMAECDRPGQKSESLKVCERLPQLTPREKEILEFLVAGKSLKWIAATCAISVQSVWRHQQRILSKFSAENTVELVQRLLTREGDNSTRG